MKNLFKSYTLISGLLLVSACSSDDWNPGPEVEATMGVYFDTQSEYSYLIEPEDNHQLELTLGRIDAEKEVTVPFTIVSCPESVVAPQSVTFQAGSHEASVILDVTGMPEKTSGVVELQIDPAYTYTYAAGTSSLHLDIQMTGAWIPVSDGVTIRYEDSDYNNIWPVQSTQILYLDGTDRFKIVDFLYSGLDLYFNVKDKDEHQTSGSSEIVPYKNSISYEEVFDEDDDYDMWVFYDTDKQELPTWTPPGAPSPVDFVSFYSGKSYEAISFKTGTGKFLADLEYTNGSWKFLYITIEFKPKFNPFDVIEDNK